MDIRKFIQNIKEQKIIIDSFIIQYSASNPIETLKLIVYSKIENFYWSYVQKKENKKIDWIYADYPFDEPKLKPYFEKYPWIEIIEKYLLADLSYPPPILEHDSKIMNFIYENKFEEKRKIISVLKGKPEPLFCSFPADSFSFSLNQLKNSINHFTRINSFRSPKQPVKFDLIAGEYSYSFYGGEFLKNQFNPPYNELRNLIKENRLNESEILYLVFHLKQNHKSNQILQYTQSESIDIIPNFNLKNEFENDVIQTIKGNYATSEILTSVKSNGQRIDSKFTDFQAFCICKGLKDQNSLYNKFLKKNHTQDDTFKAHQIAMKTLEKYGREVIGFLLSLPELPFKCENFKTIFSVLDKAKSEGTQAPSITLNFKNSKDNTQEEISFSFLIENRNSYVNVMKVYNKTTKQNVMTISRNGLVVPQENTRIKGKNNNITPIIEFFYHITETEDGFKKAVFSYGIETGKCSICGRELTSKISKIKGIGPVCEKYFSQ